MCVLASWSIERIKTQTEKDLSATLKTTLAISDEAINIWYDENKADALTWAASAKLVAAIQKQLAIPTVREDLLSSPVLAELDAIVEFLVGKHTSYLGYNVLTPDGVIIASNYKADIGRQSPVMKQSDVYTKALHGKFAISWPFVSEIPLPARNGAFIENETFMFVVAPVFDKAGKVIAMLCLKIDPAENFSRITQLGRMGNTGETYAFDKNGKAVTESRFDHQRLAGLVSQKNRGILSFDIRDPGGDTTQGFAPKIPRDQQPLTHMAADAIAGNSGVNVKGYRDYRGVPVVGAWTWNQNFQVGMATEIDLDEAYLAYIHSRNTLVFAFSSVALLFLSIAVIFNRNKERTSALTNALIAEQSHLKALIENAPDAIITIGKPGLITLFNPVAERMFGYSLDESVGKDLHELIVPERYHQKAREGMKKFFETGEGAILGKTLEISALRGDGSEFPVELSISKIKTGAGWKALAIIRDITERKRLEENLERTRKQMLTSQKLASIGRLTDGVCHEILNPLNIISLQAQLLSKRRSDDPDLMGAMEKIKQQVQRVKKITDLLLMFSGRESKGSEEVRIETVLDMALSLVENDFKLGNIKIVRNFEPGLPEIRVETEDLKQAVLNILNNAKDAMPKGGTLTVSAGKIHENADGFIRVKFSDTGVGIKTENMGKIFDPFFSSKPEGEGKGMGLAVCHALIEKNGGTITVESEEGKGATFIIDLPPPPSIFKGYPVRQKTANERTLAGC